MVVSVSTLFHTILTNEVREAWRSSSGQGKPDRWSDSSILPLEQARVPHPTHAHMVGGQLCSLLQHAGAEGLFSKQPCVVLRGGNNLISRQMELRHALSLS